MIISPILPNIFVFHMQQLSSQCCWFCSKMLFIFIQNHAQIPLSYARQGAITETPCICLQISQFGLVLRSAPRGQGIIWIDHPLIRSPSAGQKEHDVYSTSTKDPQIFCNCMIDQFAATKLNVKELEGCSLIRNTHLMLPRFSVYVYNVCVLVSVNV